MMTMAEQEIVELPSETVAVVRSMVPMDGLSAFFAQAYGRVAGAVPAAGGRVTGPPFAWYHAMPGETVDVSAGFAVAGDVHVPDGGVHVVERPGGRALVTVHAGSYEGLGGAWAELASAVVARGWQGRDDFWEEYLTEPTGDPSALRTRLVLPLA
jgi:effector-binding domain-containing protein